MPPIAVSATVTDIFWLLLECMGLLGLNTCLTAFEFSVGKLRSSNFNDDIIEQLNRAKHLARLLEQPEATHQAIRLCIITSTIAYGVLIYLFATELMVVGIDSNLAGVWPLVWALALLLALGLLYPISELLAHALAMRSPVATIRNCARVVSVSIMLAQPVLWALNLLTKALLKILRIEKTVASATHDIETLVDELEEGASPVSPMLVDILKSTVQLRKLVAEDVLLPRNQIKYFDINHDNATNIALAKDTGHTRFPLCDSDLDKCIGLVHIKDIFHSPFDEQALDLRQLSRDINKVRADESLENVLQKLLHTRSHMALVVDEFGGTEGVITLERILEELVGDIQDEFDADEALILPLSMNEYKVSGLTPIHDVEERLDVTIDNDEVSTFGGLITAELGRIPNLKEQLCIKSLAITITEVDETRVIATHVKISADAEQNKGSAK